MYFNAVLLTMQCFKLHCMRSANLFAFVIVFILVPTCCFKIAFGGWGTVALLFLTRILSHCLSSLVLCFCFLSSRLLILSTAITDEWFSKGKPPLLWALLCFSKITGKIQAFSSAIGLAVWKYNMHILIFISLFFTYKWWFLLSWFPYVIHFQKL